MKLALSSVNSSKNGSFKNGSFYVGLIVGLLLITIVITVPYIRSQQAFLGGDINDSFYQFLLEVTDGFRQSPLVAFQLIHQSFDRDYNKLFSLPLIPFVLAFGNSYLVYVISLAIVYFIPFTLVMGAIATQLIPVYPQAVFASTSLIAALITPNWITMLQGYPDISAALIIALAIWVCLQGIRQDFIWLFPFRWQIPLLGFLFGVAVLFRRHFVYAVIAVLGAVFIYTAVVFGLQLRHNARAAWRNLWQFGLRISLVIATSSITLLLLAWRFTLRALTEDYVSLYDSWSRPWFDVFSFYSSLYGWLIWILAIAGFVAGLCTRMLNLPVAVLISSCGGVSIGLWLFKLRYTETYYALHFVPFLLLGVSAFVWTIGLQLSRIKRSLFLALFSCLLLINAVFGITAFSQNNQVSQISAAIRPWLAASFPPPIRSDYDRVVQVVDFLRQLAPAQEPIFVVYTAHLPMHLLKAAERTVYGKDGSILNLNQGSPTDSDGFYPLPDLLKAEYVVVTQPFVAWNAPEQQVIKTVFDAFTQEWELTQDFERLSQRFSLQGNTAVNIYRRIRPTPIDRAVRTLHTLQTQVNKPLGKQRDWISLNPSPDASVKRNRKNQQLNLSAIVPAANQNNPASFLYLATLPESAEVKGQAVLSQTCVSVRLAVSSLNQQGQLVNAMQTLQLTQTSPLNLELNSTGASYLLLQASQPQANAETPEPCLLKINNLQVN